MDGWEKRLVVSNRAHIVFDMHQVDSAHLAQPFCKAHLETQVGVALPYLCRWWV